jgi:hypothetical protein
MGSSNPSAMPQAVICGNKGPRNSKFNPTEISFSGKEVSSATGTLSGFKCFVFLNKFKIYQK